MKHDPQVKLPTRQIDTPTYRFFTGIDLVIFELPDRRMTLNCRALLLARYWDEIAEEYICHCQGHNTNSVFGFTLPLRCGPLEYEVRNAMTKDHTAVPITNQRPQGKCAEMSLAFSDGTIISVYTSRNAAAPTIKDFASSEDVNEYWTRLVSGA
jgi:hypothetical protein